MYLFFPFQGVASFLLVVVWRPMRPKPLHSYIDVLARPCLFHFSDNFSIWLMDDDFSRWSLFISLWLNPHLDCWIHALIGDFQSFLQTIQHLLPVPALKYVNTSAVFPDPDPDLYVFEPPRAGSGSVSQKYGSGSGSFHHQAKIVKKNFLLFCDFYCI